MNWTLIKFDEDLWEWHGVDVTQLPDQWLLRAFRTQLTQGTRADWSVSVSMYGYGGHAPLAWDRLSLINASEPEVQALVIQWGENITVTPMSMLRDGLR